MRFKEFLLKEDNENYFMIKVGDILTALQTIYEDSGVMSRKDIDDYLTNVVNRTRPLLKTKSNPNNLKVIQKVAINIMKYLDPKVPNANIDPKTLIYSCIKELENLLSGKESVVNKLYKKDPKGLPEPEGSINQQLKNSSANLKQVELGNPGMETGVDNDKSPPLSGDGQRTLNVI
jgi:hypothetical protein